MNKGQQALIKPVAPMIRLELETLRAECIASKEKNFEVSKQTLRYLLHLYDKR